MLDDKTRRVLENAIAFIKGMEANLGQYRKGLETSLEELKKEG